MKPSGCGYIYAVDGGDPGGPCYWGHKEHPVPSGHEWQPNTEELKAEIATLRAELENRKRVYEQDLAPNFDCLMTDYRDAQERLQTIASLCDMAVKGDKDALARPNRIASYARGANPIDTLKEK